MASLVQDSARLAAAKQGFARELATAHASQVVLMTLAVGGEIGAQTSELDQFFRIEAGEGQAVLEGVVAPIRQGQAVLVPAGAQHNIRNTGIVPLRLVSIYTPLKDRCGVGHHPGNAPAAVNLALGGMTAPQG